MAQRYSDVFGVAPDQLDQEGAFNGFVDIDSPFHVDPYLLRDVRTPELQNSYQRFRAYFEDVIRLLRASRRTNDAMYRAAIGKLVFRELPNISLGYCTASAEGSGIGLRLAKSLTRTASEIVSAGFTDPIIFELVGLLEERIGADRISDMTIRIILPDLLAFSQRIAHNLAIAAQQVEYDDESFSVPVNPVNNRALVLVPHEILRHLPMAYDWSDIDYVCSYNEQLRHVVNRIVGDTWRHATRRIPKRELKDAVLRYPDLLRDLIDQYTAKPPSHYDFQKDPLGMLIWQDIAQDFAGRYPLALSLAVRPDPAQVLELVIVICNHFRRLVENNGLNRLFYDDQSNLRRETFAQLLFYGIADSYCEANNLDLSRESNAGRGPVDFKVSRGYSSRVTVEVKYSSNPHLRNGFTTQLPIYNEADRTDSSVYLIIRTTESTAVIESVRDLRQQATQQGNRVPEIIVVDGRLHPSASRA